VEKSALISKVRVTGPEGELLHYIGEHLCSIITGKSPFGSILAETPLLDVFFQKSPQLQRSYQQTAQYLTLLSNHNPHLKVLELGTGAGNPTLPILQGLGGSEGSVPKFAKYDIVNTGRASFEPLKERLAPWADLMEEKSFNAEDSPEKQGFEEGSYDVVIAVYLSLGSDSIDAMIRNISRVLKPGGTLILIEGNRNRIAVTTAFGTLPGWWIGDITQPESQHFEDKWQALLLENRFSNFSAILRDAPEPDNQSTVMISRTKMEEKKMNRNVDILIITENDKCGIWMVRLLKALSGLNLHVGFSMMANANPAGKICIVLSELSQSLLHHPTETQFETIKNIFLRSSGVLWAVRGASEKDPVANMVTGVARTVRSETSDVAIITVDIDEMASEIDATDSISALFNRHFVEDPKSERNSDTEYMLKDGRLLIPRLIPNDEVDQSIKSDILGSSPEDQPFVQSDRPLRLEVGRPGLLDTMHFVDDEEMAGELLDDCVEIEVRAVGFNFRDVMMAMGQIAVETLGGECSGVVTAVGKATQGVAVGDRVACVHLGTFCNFVRPKASIVQKIPDDMTFEVGASLPVVYCTAFYSLFHVANLREGESVLVHAASGGLGQAMIQLCQMAKARIFATVGSKEKKQLLMESFGIPEDHIFSSRDGSFSKGVMRMTDNRGVDVVMNSLAGEALRLTWSCVAPFGRFVELGKRDFFINSHLEMAKFAKNVTFAAVDLVDLIRQRTELVGEVWSNSMKLIRDRTVKPPAPITVFSMAEIEKGLKTMQAGRHMGKLVAVPQSNEIVKVGRVRMF
jgi:NADPH:quinone reductase-like Zn-dependent oxidoreductase/SAM-dependent methyltransferase